MSISGIDQDHWVCSPTLSLLHHQSHCFILNTYWSILNLGARYPKGSKSKILFADTISQNSNLDSNSDSEAHKYRVRSSSTRRKLNSNTRISFYGQPVLFRENVIIRRGSGRIKHMSGLRK
jgi:hypothetical protein